MKPKTICTIMWFSIILLLLGMIVLSPMVQILMMISAAMCGLIIVIYGTLAFRIIGILLLLAAVSLTAINYPEAKRQYDGYKENEVHKRRMTSSITSKK